MKNNKEQKKRVPPEKAMAIFEITIGREEREREEESIDLQIGRRKAFQRDIFTQASRYDLVLLQTRLRETT